MPFNRMALAVAHVLSVLLVVLTFSFSQAPDTLWTRYFGGTSEDKGFCAKQTSNGGYIIAGYTTYLDYDFFIVKTDANGYAQWSKIYGVSNDDIAYSVCQTTDGCYAVVGYSTGLGVGFEDAYFLKTNASGDTLWSKTYGWTNSENRGYTVQQTTDGGYIIGGSAQTHALMIKTDANGNAQWIKEYGVLGYACGFGAVQTSDKGFLLGGFYYNVNNYDFYLVKTDSMGDTLWTRIHGGPLYEICHGVMETSDHYYIAVGGYDEELDKQGRYWADVYVVKYDQNGNFLWSRIIGGDNDDMAYSVIEASDGNYIIVGRTRSFGAGDYDIYLVKMNRNGDTLWTGTYGRGGTEWGHSVQQTTDGGYILGGWGGHAGFYLDMYLVKTAPEMEILEQKKNQISPIVLEVYPNPFRDKTLIRYQIPITKQESKNSEISLKIYDAMGRVVKTFPPKFFNSNSSNITWDGSDDLGRPLPNGVYLLESVVDNYSSIKNLLFIK